MPDIRILGTIGPFDPSDPYPTHRDIYGHGGYRSVATLAERDAIHPWGRKVGMAVYVIENRTLYILGPGLGNADWYVHKPWSLRRPYAMWHAGNVGGLYSGLTTWDNHAGEWWAAWYGRFPAHSAVPNSVHNLLTVGNIVVRMHDSATSRSIVVTRGSQTLTYANISTIYDADGNRLVLVRSSDSIRLIVDGIRLDPDTGDPTHADWRAPLPQTVEVRVAATGSGGGYTWTHNMRGACLERVIVSRSEYTEQVDSVLASSEYDAAMQVVDAFTEAIVLRPVVDWSEYRVLFGNISSSYEPMNMEIVGDSPAVPVGHWAEAFQGMDTLDPRTLWVRNDGGMYRYDSGMQQLNPMCQAAVMVDTNAPVAQGRHHGDLYIQIETVGTDTVSKLWCWNSNEWVQVSQHTTPQE